MKRITKTIVVTGVLALIGGSSCFAKTLITIKTPYIDIYEWKTEEESKHHEQKKCDTKKPVETDKKSKDIKPYEENKKHDTKKPVSTKTDKIDSKTTKQKDYYCPYCHHKEYKNYYKKYVHNHSHHKNYDPHGRRY